MLSVRLKNTEQDAECVKPCCEFSPVDRELKNVMQLFNIILVQPIFNILVVFFHLLTLLHVPSALGFAIIAMTVFIRLILYPFTASQIKTTKKMQELNPHLSRIREVHKGDSARQQKETMALYKEHGVNPASGCLLMIIQLPVIWALYSVLGNTVKYTKLSQINNLIYTDSLKLHHLWDTNFFGLPLGKTPSELIGIVGWLVLLVPVLTGIFQFIQSKMMFQSAPQVPGEKKKEGDFASAFQTQSIYLFPLMIGFFSYQFPIGLSLYWNTFTIFGIIQQYKIQGLAGLVPVSQPLALPEKKGPSARPPKSKKSGKSKRK